MSAFVVVAGMLILMGITSLLWGDRIVQANGGGIVSRLVAWPRGWAKLLKWPMGLMLIYAGIALLLSLLEREPITLEDGYRVIRIYGDAHTLVSPDNKEIVRANVVSASNDARYLFGLREVPVPDAEPSINAQQPYGYFIYDKRERELRLGLSREEFVRALTDAGTDFSSIQ